jgi:hypothetical protein
MRPMATTKRSKVDPAPPGADVSGNGWDGAAGPPEAGRPAGEPMPRRAAGLPSQDGPAMRAVFAYLLDEDAAPPASPPAPSPKTRRR